MNKFKRFWNIVREPVQIAAVMSSFAVGVPIMFWVGTVEQLAIFFQ